MRLASHFLLVARIFVDGNASRVEIQKWARGTRAEAGGEGEEVVATLGT